MRAFDIGTIHSRTTDATGTRFRFVFDYYNSHPTLSLYRYTHGDSPSGLVAPWSGTTKTVTLPHITFGRAYRLRKIGGLRLYRLVNRFYIRTIGF